MPAAGGNRLANNLKPNLSQWAYLSLQWQTDTITVIFCKELTLFVPCMLVPATGAAAAATDPEPEPDAFASRRWQLVVGADVGAVQYIPAVEELEVGCWGGVGWEGVWLGRFGDWGGDWGFGGDWELEIGRGLGIWAGTGD